MASTLTQRVDVLFTARFSEAFHQKVGHEATDELAECLNSLDASNRNELKRLLMFLASLATVWLVIAVQKL
jgi:hypothetical protein